MEPIGCANCASMLILCKEHWPAEDPIDTHFEELVQEVEERSTTIARPAILFERESIRTFVTPRGTMQRKPTVYRIYRDLERTQLIYAGATMQPRTRLLAHIAQGMPGTVVELEFFRNSTQMSVAEAVAMKETMERPTIAQRHGTWKARA